MRATTMHLAVVAAMVTAVVSKRMDDMGLALVQLHGSLQKRSVDKSTFRVKSGKGKGGNEKEVNVEWKNLERAQVLPYKGVDIVEDSCTFVKALGAWGSGDVTLHMIGDSTMFHQAKGACMSATKHFHTPDGPWSTPDFGVLLKVTKPEFIKSTVNFVDGTHFSCEIPLPHGKLSIGFYGVGMPPHDLDGLTEMKKVFGGKNPDILYFAAGLHYLHMEPKAMVWGPAAINASKSFDKEMQKFLSHPVVKETPQVVYFKSHSICDERYTGEFQSIVSELKKDPKEVAKNCAAHVEKEWEMDVSPQQCLDHFLVRENAMKINEQAESAIKAWSAKNPGKQVKMVDGFRITDADKCEHTDINDGRHYMPLVPTELAELLKQVGATGSADSTYVQGAGC